MQGEYELLMSLLIRTLILLMGPHSVTSFDLNNFLRDSVFKFSHIGVRASRPKFGGEGHTLKQGIVLQGDDAATKVQRGHTWETGKKRWSLVSRDFICQV